jgi:hypothetical protein
MHKLKKKNITYITIILVVSIGWFLFYQPTLFIFHANISSFNSDVTGKVFKSSDGIYFIQLNSGSQLSLQNNPLRVFLLPKSRQIGFRIGQYLIVSADAMNGVDLSKNEGFDKQVPIIDKNEIRLKDPMKQNGSFSFPISK